ncbi:MAG: hypothetical protein JST47_12485 [Bacteroidetes bacterium]|nr:hypothetical protein [Bacteroidota bacterium]
MENQNQLDNIFKISFDDNAREQLRSISLWAKISAICAFIGYGIALIVAFLGKTKAGFVTGNDADVVGSMARGSIVASALVTAIIGTAINYFLYKFAVDAKQGLSGIDQVKLNTGLSSLKTYFKILGIILLICLIIVALVILFAMFASLGRP